MTSKLKCPVCNHELYQTASEPATYCCLYKDCQSDFKFAGSKELWQALIQTKEELKDCQHNYSVKSEQHERGYAYATKTIKDLENKLEIATKALDKADRFFDGTIGLYQSEMMAIIKTALEQIEHKE